MVVVVLVVPMVVIVLLVLVAQIVPVVLIVLLALIVLLVLMVSMVLVALELNFHSIEILVEKQLKVQCISLVEFSSREIFITTCMCMLNVLFCLIY